jgi:WD40 repeat protein
LDHTLRLWDLGTSQTIRTLEGHTDSVWSVAVTPAGRRALSGSLDRTLRLWDLETGQMIRLLEGHSGWVYVVAVTPDGCRAFSASADHTLRVWHLESGEETAAFPGESAMVSCALIPDGRTVVAGDELGGVHFLRFVEADPTKP